MAPVIKELHKHPDEFNCSMEKTIKLLEDTEEYECMSKAVNPYGDGKASEIVIACLLKEIKNG